MITHPHHQTDHPPDITDHPPVTIDTDVSAQGVQLHMFTDVCVVLGWISHCVWYNLVFQALVVLLISRNCQSVLHNDIGSDDIDDKFLIVSDFCFIAKLCTVCFFISRRVHWERKRCKTVKCLCKNNITNYYQLIDVVLSLLLFWGCKCPNRSINRLSSGVSSDEKLCLHWRCRDFCSKETLQRPELQSYWPLLPYSETVLL